MYMAFSLTVVFVSLRRLLYRRNLIDFKRHYLMHSTSKLITSVDTIRCVQCQVIQASPNFTINVIQS